MHPAVELQELTRRFGRFVAVDRLSLTVAPGEVFGLLGSNGAGKSTAIRMMCGLLRPSAGRASVLGIDVGRRPDEVKRRIGYMSQKFSLYDDLTVRQNLRFFAGVYGLAGAELAERVTEAVALAGLVGQEDRLTGSLPGGFKQRLALASTLLHRPELIFLDEPTGGVDPLARRDFWRQIDALAGAGVTVLVTTHYLDEAEHCHRIALIHAGRLVALGSLAELRTVFAGRAVFEIATSNPIAGLDLLEKEPWVQEAAIFGRDLHLVAQDPAAGERAVALLEAAGLGPAAASPAVPSLEDIFLHAIEAEAQHA